MFPLNTQTLNIGTLNIEMPRPETHERGPMRELNDIYRSILHKDFEL